MAFRPSDPLLTSARFVIVAGQALLCIAGAGLAIAAIGIPLASTEITRKLRAEFADPDFALSIPAIVAVMLLAIVAVVLLFLFLRNMRRIIDTVGEGDPFVPANALRLTRMAWLMLGVQLLALPIATIGMMISSSLPQTDRIDIGADLDFSGIVMVVVLFVLARVFRHGAAMREDLEGTV